MAIAVESLSTIHAIIAKGSQPPDVADPRVLRLEWTDGGRPTTDFFPISMVTGVWFDRLLQYVKRMPSRSSSW
jgi:hypothetical protein